jgi:probable LLM family oxidoreductase
MLYTIYMNKTIKIGIDSFAAHQATGGNELIPREQALEELLARIEHADAMGLHIFGIGEHFREDFLDSAPHMILAAAATRTKNIILTSAVTVLSAADPVRVFQNFATLDLISKGRAEIVVGRASFTEAFPLFGLNLEDYDELFAEKLDLLLKIRGNEKVTWRGKFRAPLTNQAIYPRPLQKKLPIWLGVGGTPESFVRAGTLGLPLAVAVIGGQTLRFKPLVDLYRAAGKQAGHKSEDLEVCLHSLGYVAKTTEVAKEEYYPGYKEMFSKIGKERGWGPITREGFEAQADELGAYVIGSPKDVAEKIIRHSKALGGISRFTFQMDNASMSHTQLMSAIELIGKEVIPLVNKEL